MLARVLGIRIQDRRDAIVGFLLLFMLMAGHAILETARDGLFLAHLPARMLPWAYLVMAVATLLAASLSRNTLWRFSRRRSLSLLLFAGASVNVAFFGLSSLAGSASTLLMFYVWTGLFITILIVQFWLVLSDVFDLSQAKRVFAWIGAGGLVGATVGSATADLFLRSYRAQGLLICASALFVLAAFLPALFTRKKLPKPVHPRAEAKGEPSGFSLLRRDGYLQRLLGFVLLGTITVTGIDYVFKAVVAQSMPAAALGGFFARYYALVNGCALVIQILVAPALLRSAGVNRTLLTMPALILVASLGLGFFPGLASVLVLRGIDGSLRHSINRTATEILYLPLESAVRGRFKTLIEALGQRGGQAAASLAILVALRFGATPVQMAWVLVAASLSWLWCISGLKPFYLELFRRQLREGSIETRVSVADLDLHSLEALVSALSSEEDAEVIAALEMFASYDKMKLVPALILFHPSPAVVLRAFSLFAESKRRDVLRLSGRLLRHPDQEIRAAALRHFSAREPSREPLERCLKDASPEVRATAVVGLISLELIPEAEATELLSAIVKGGSSEARFALASSLHLLPAERSAWVAGALAQIKEPGLSGRVARAIAQRPSRAHLPVLVLLLARLDARHEARAALIKLGEPALDYLELALSNTDLPRTVRRHLPRTISRFASARAAAILTAALPKEKDDAVEYKILRGLGRMRTDDPSIPADPGVLLKCAEQKLTHAVRILAWSSLVERGRAASARYDTAAGELLSAVLGDYEAATLERFFRLLQIFLPTEEVAMIYEGLGSADASVRAGSLELLEHVVPESMREGVLALVDDAPPFERLLRARSFYDWTAAAPLPLDDEALGVNLGERRSLRGALHEAYTQALEQMLDDESPVLRSVAGYHAAELGIERLETKIASRRVEPRANLKELTEGLQGTGRMGLGHA